MIPLLVLTKFQTLPISAASGIARLGETTYIVADDETFVLAGEKKLQVLPGLPPGKAHKADLEAIVKLDEQTLLALGSGSSPKRRRGVFIRASGTQVIDLGPLYDALKIAQLNIEGAAVVKDELLLFHRGATSAVITLKKGVYTADAIKSVRELSLGALDGVPLSITDACALPDGRIVFVAAAEDTTNPYDDGKVTGSVVGFLGGKTWRLQPKMKAEGVLAMLRQDGAVDVLIVNDPDDRKQKASVYMGLLQ